jgi:hypothetical protein
VSTSSPPSYPIFSSCVLPKPFSLLPAGFEIEMALSALPMLCRVECKHPDHHIPSSYLPGRHRYAPPPLPSIRCICPLKRRYVKGTGIAAVYTLTLVRQNVVFNLKQERITNAFFSCTLALNAFCTGSSLLGLCAHSCPRNSTMWPTLLLHYLIRTDRVSNLADSKTDT